MRGGGLDRWRQAGVSQPDGVQLREGGSDLLIRLQEDQEVFAGVFSFVHDFIHELHHVTLHIFSTDDLQVVVLPPRDQFLLTDFVEDESVVSTQNHLDVGFIAPQGVFGRHVALLALLLSFSNSGRQMETGGAPGNSRAKVSFCP